MNTIHQRTFLVISLFYSSKLWHFFPWKFLIVFQRWLFLALNFFNGFWIVIFFFFIFSKSSVRKPKSIKYTHNLDPNVTTSGQKVVTLVLQQISQGQADTSPAVIQGPLILTTPPRPPQQTFASRLQGDWLKREFQNTPVPNVPAAKGEMISMNFLKKKINRCVAFISLFENVPLFMSILSKWLKDDPNLKGRNP